MLSVCVMEMEGLVLRHGQNVFYGLAYETNIVIQIVNALFYDVSSKKHFRDSNLPLVNSATV